MTDVPRGSPPAERRTEALQPRQPAPSATGPGWGIRPRFVVDVVLTLSFVALMSVPFTGLLLHEW